MQFVMISYRMKFNVREEKVIFIDAA